MPSFSPPPTSSVDEIINWSPSLSVGVPCLDRDHKLLLDFTERLSGMLLHADVQSITCTHAIETLLSIARFHLKREEFLMQALRFPERSGHEKVHDGLREWCENIENTLSNDCQAATLRKKVIFFVATWWVNHIMKQDKEYIPFFASFQEETAQAAQAFEEKHQAEWQHILEALAPYGVSLD
jgi:hemerythrin